MRKHLALLSLVVLPTVNVRAYNLSTRRGWIARCAGAIPAAALCKSAHAAKLETYNDQSHGFSVDVPQEWAKTEQKLFDRRKLLLWTAPEDPSINFFAAYTPVRDDFTSLGSFGSVDQVAAQTILPKGQLAGQEVKAEMLSAKSAKQAYLFDYTQSVPGVQPATHFRTIFTLKQGATGGAGAVLVTLTAQCPEEKYAANKDLFDSIINSYSVS